MSAILVLLLLLLFTAAYIISFVITTIYYSDTTYPLIYLSTLCVVHSEKLKVKLHVSGQAAAVQIPFPETDNGSGARKSLESSAAAAAPRKRTSFVKPVIDTSFAEDDVPNLLLSLGTPTSKIKDGFFGDDDGLDTGSSAAKKAARKEKRERKKREKQEETNEKDAGGDSEKDPTTKKKRRKKHGMEGQDDGNDNDDRHQDFEDREVNFRLPGKNKANKQPDQSDTKKLSPKSARNEAAARIKAKLSKWRPDAAPVVEDVVEDVAPVVEKRHPGRPKGVTKKRVSDVSEASVSVHDSGGASKSLIKRRKRAELQISTESSKPKAMAPPEDTPRRVFKLKGGKENPYLHGPLESPLAMDSHVDYGDAFSLAVADTPSALMHLDPPLSKTNAMLTNDSLKFGKCTALQ